MAQMYLRNAHKIECSSAFPPTAKSTTIRISKIDPPDSALLIYTPAMGDAPLKCDGPESEHEVLVSGHEIYAQPVSGCKSFQVDFIGWVDNI